MASIRTVLELANQQFMSAIKQSSDAVKNFEKDSVTAGSNSTGSFKKIDIAAAALTATMIALGKQSLTFADELVDIANATQSSASSILGLAAALQESGGKAENSGRLFQSLSNKITEANSGNLKTIDVFNKLGVSFTDLGNASETQIRNKLIKSIAELPTASERAARGMDLFGKAAMGVDFLTLAAEIDKNTEKYKQYESALRTAADAQGALDRLVMDLKVAFVTAFEPIFKIIGSLNINVDALALALKGIAAVLLVLGSAAVISGIIGVAKAIVGIGIALNAIPIARLASIIAIAGIGILEFTGLVDKLTDATASNTDTLNEQIDALQQNGELAGRDQKGALDALAKQGQGLRDIVDRYKESNKAIREKLDLEMQGITQGEQQKRISQTTAEIQQNAEKALIDLKKQYFGLDADGRGRQNAAYEAQKKIIMDIAETEKAAAIEQIKRIETLRSAQKDLTSGLQIRAKAEEELYRLQQGLTPRDEQASIINNEEVNRVLQRRQVLLEWIIANKASLSLYDIGEGLLQGSRSSEEFVAQIQAAIEKVKELGETNVDVADLFKAVVDQLLAIDQAAGALTQSKLDAADQQRSFSYGWGKAFQEYADNAGNAANTAKTLFGKATQGMEDALVKFAKTGKFEWKQFLNMMLEELLRAQIRSVFAKLLSGMSGLFGGGGGAGGGLLGGLLGGGKGGKSGGLLGGLIGGVSKGVGKLVGGIGSAIGGLFGGGSSDRMTGTAGGGGFGTGADFGNQDFGGFFASGGALASGKWGIAGEAGPELITGPANITPLGQLGTTNVTYNINAVDAASFKQMIARDPQFIYAVTQAGARSMPGAR